MAATPYTASLGWGTDPSPRNVKRCLQMPQSSEWDGHPGLGVPPSVSSVLMRRGRQMYTCTHTHTQMHSHTHTCVHTRLHSHTYRSADMPTQMYTHTCTYKHARVYSPPHKHMRSHTRTHTRVHSHMHTYAHTHAHTNMHTSTHTNTCVHTRTHTSTLTYAHTHTHTCIHRHAQTRAHMDTHMHGCIQTHECTHALVHTCTYIHGRAHMQTHRCTQTQAHRHTHECTHTSAHTRREMTPRPWKQSLAPCDPPELGRQGPLSPTTEEGVRGQSRGGRVPGRTHRWAAVPAAVPGPALGQTLLLLVQRPRLQDHLLQLEGGVAVQAAFLWKMALSWCLAALAHPGHPRPTGLRWAQSQAPPSSRSAQPTARRPEQGPPACPAGWTLGAWGSR